MDVVTRKLNGLRRHLFGLGDVARFGKGVVRVVAAGLREQEVVGGLDKALHVVDHDGVGVYVKHRLVAEEVRDRVNAAVTLEAHALGHVGARQIKPVVEVRDAHVGHVGEILIEADGRGLGGVHFVPHDGQGFFRIALREGRDAERQHHRERENHAKQFFHVLMSFPVFGSLSWLRIREAMTGGLNCGISPVTARSGGSGAQRRSCRC